MIKKSGIIFYLAVYAALRVFSFYFPPVGYYQIINGAVCFAILLSASYLIMRNDIRGWLIIAAEIILGGAGNFLSIGGLSLRTLLLASAVCLYFFGKCRLGQFSKTLSDNRAYIIAVSTLFLWLGFSACNGLRAGHDIKLIISGIIPYLFFLYYLPLREIIRNLRFRESVFALLVAAVLGNAAFMLATLAGYSSGFFVLQDSYYHWFRDVANGKITEFPFHFYRIVLNEQLLIIPLFLLMAGRNIKKPQALYCLMSALLLFILCINFTRIYILALIFGLALLFAKINWKRWLLYSAASLFFFFFIFTLTHSVASRGQSLGWEYFGLRLQSIAEPAVEDSSLSRMLILPIALHKIAAHPFFGGGLGDVITVYSPVFNQSVTVHDFDWGYLQIIDENGVVGFVIFLATLYFIFIPGKTGFKQLLSEKKELMVASSSLLIINITSPALFHVMGIIWLVLMAAEASHVCAEPRSAPLHSL